MNADTILGKGNRSAVLASLTLAEISVYLLRKPFIDFINKNFNFVKINLILTMVDMLSKFVFIRKVDGIKAKSTEETIISCLKNFILLLFQSLRPYYFQAALMVVRLRLRWGIVWECRLWFWG